MGVAGAIIGGLAAGFIGSALMGGNRRNAPDFSGMQARFADTVAAVPATPEAPVSPDEGGKSDAMLAAEEEERKRRAAGAAANKTRYSGGLGVTSAANVGRKTLLG